jgi:ribonuclease P protein component
MIRVKNRFHGYGSLKYVYQNGRTVRGPLFAVKAVSNPRRSTYRLAVVVSRKVNKSAVDRNRIRRRLYESARNIETKLTAADIVLTVYNDAVLDEPWANLNIQLKKQLEQACVLKPKNIA